MTDTHPKIQIKLNSMMIKKTGAERLKMGLSMFDMAKKLIIASLLMNGKGGNVRRELLLRLYQSDVNLKTINKFLEKEKGS